MAMTMTEFLVLAQPGIDKVHLEEEQAFEEQYSRIFNVKTQGDLYDDEAKMAGFGGMVEIAEGGDVTYDEAISPVTRRYNLSKRGLGYKVTDKLWKFDRYGQVAKLERALMRADKHDTEQFAFGLLNSATATTIATGFDGLALASTAHTRMDGGATQANRPTTLAALSLTALEDAVIAFTKLVDDRGRPYISVPRKLIIPLDLRLVAREILGSAMNPNTANNATNALKDEFDITPVATPYITSSTFWALVGDKHDLQIRWNERPKSASETDFDSDTIKRKVTKWLGRGFGEYRGYYQGNT